MNKQAQRAIDSLTAELISMFPDDPLVAEEKKKLEARNPDLARAIAPYVPNQPLFEYPQRLGDKSPWTSEELLSVAPELRIRQILDFKKTGWREPNRDGLINAITSAADQNSEWAFEFLAALLRQGEKDNEFWHRVLWKLKWDKLSVEQRNWLVDSFDTSFRYSDDFLNGYAHLVFANGFPKAEDTSSSNLLEKQLKLTFHLWYQTKGDPGWNVEGPPSGNDWIFEAINRPPGHCCLFWLKYTELQQKRNPDEERAWPAKIEPLMNEVVQGQSRGEILGLALLGQYLAAVRYMAPEWTKERLYPCFDFQSKGDRAFPAWLGYSGYGHLSTELVAEMPSYFVTAFPRIKQFSDPLAERFTGFVASIAISRYASFKRNDWLKKFHAGIDEKLDRKWLSHLARFLRGSLPEDKKRVWEEWLYGYWQDRLEGVPYPIAKSETEAFYKLALALGPIAHEALPLLARLPKADVEWSHVFLDLEKNTLFQEDPQGLVGIIAWWLKQVRSIVAGPKEVTEFVHRVSDLPELRPNLDIILDELTRLNRGCAQAFSKAVIEKFGE